MRLANPKSLVVSVLLLSMALRTMLRGGHPRFIALHYFVLIVCPILAVCCVWHAFKGKRPLLGRSELHTSLMLGSLSLLLAVGPTLAWLSYHFPAPSVLVAVLFSATAAFFFMHAIRERDSASARGGL
jgi:hypothetical protein